jgi:hypothetical protein
LNGGRPYIEAGPASIGRAATIAAAGLSKTISTGLQATWAGMVPSPESLPAFREIAVNHDFAASTRRHATNAGGERSRNHLARRLVRAPGIGFL